MAKDYIIKFSSFLTPRHNIGSILVHLEENENFPIMRYNILAMPRRPR